MMIVLAQTTGQGDTAQRTLLYSTRTLELPQQQTEIQEVATKTQLPPTSMPATSTPEQLLTPTVSVDNQSANQGQPDPNEINDRISPFATAILPVALLLLSVLGVVIWQATRNKDR